MYKFIALDIDGTLLNSKGEIDKTTKEAIFEAQKRRALVTISTGRPIQGVTKYIQELKIDAPIITYNGAMIVDSVSNDILYSKGLSRDDARQAIELGLSRDISMVIWANNELYVNRIDDNVDQYKLLSGNIPIVVDDYNKVIDLGITKVLWIDTASNIQKHMSEISKTISKTISYCTSKATYLEFFDINVSKANALEFLSKEYDIKREEMIAIGDGYNDLSMIEYAGLGVAMGNAESGVKAKADYITKSNDDNGIQEVIKKFILEGKDIK